MVLGRVQYARRGQRSREVPNDAWKLLGQRWERAGQGQWNEILDDRRRQRFDREELCVPARRRILVEAMWILLSHRLSFGCRQRPQLETASGHRRKAEDEPRLAHVSVESERHCVDLSSTYGRTPSLRLVVRHAVQQAVRQIHNISK